MKPTPPELHVIEGKQPAGIPVLTRDFRVNPRLCKDFEALMELAKHRRRIEQQEHQIQQRLQAAIGHAQKAVFAKGYAVWVKGQDRIGLNTEEVLAQFPQLLDEYPQIQIGPRRLEFRTPDVVLEYPDTGSHDYE